MKAFEWEIERISWEHLRTAYGPSAATIPKALQDLAASTTEDAARSAYWRIDNVVVVQGQVFEAAQMVISPLLQLLCLSGDIVRRRVLELLIQITSGNIAASEIEHGNNSLAERCRAHVREGLAIVYSSLNAIDWQIRDRAVELLASIDQDTERLQWTLSRVAESDPDPRVRELALSLLADMTAE